MNSSLNLALFLAAERAASLRAEAQRERWSRVSRRAPAGRSFLGRRLAELRAGLPVAAGGTSRTAPAADCA